MIRTPRRASMREALYRYIIHPLFETHIKQRSTLVHRHELDRTQWYSREQLESLQQSQLTALIDHCQRHSPFYRNAWRAAGCGIEQVESLSDLRRFPLTTREDMRVNADRIRVVALNQKCVKKSTGGSSGEPLSFTIDVDANDRRVAAAQRGYAMAGAEMGTRQTHLWGAAIGPTRWWKRKKGYVYDRWLHRRDLLNSFDLTESNADDFVRRINRHRPRFIVAYVNPLTTLADYVTENRIHIHQPDAIITGAEKLHDHQRRSIESAFGCEVFETYGSREFTLIGAECECHAGLHLTSENLIVEIVDDHGRPVANGEEGDIVVTDLWNRSTPFVRYQIGDRGIASDDACPCGRGLPLLKRVTGRRLDMLRLIDGKLLPGEFFPHLMKDHAGVRRFQVVQPDLSHVTVRLVVDDSFDASAGARLSNALRAGVGPATELTIERVDHIPLTRQGKHRVVVSYVDDEMPAATRCAS